LKLSGGLPSGIVGKIGIAISPANPDRVWAMVEAEPSVAGLYRSDDAGQSWQRFETNQKRRLYQRSWYFTTVFADPKNANALYVLGDNRAESEDSRVWGPVDENAVIGKAIAGLWPPEGLHS